MTMALEGTTILDLTRILPGPFCTTILADMGAEVIKVEDPNVRGFMRDTLTPPNPSPEQEERSLAHNVLARNKKSIAINLKDKEGVEIFRKLARKADVVVESFRPGITKGLSIDYATLSKLNPRLVYCSISAYGQDGPYRSMPSFDINCISLAGVLAIAGDKKGNPTHPGLPLADFSSAVNGTIGILTALLAREKTGKGQNVDISMLDTTVSWMSVVLAEFFNRGERGRPKRGSRDLDLFETKDGKLVSMSMALADLWPVFCKMIGREDLQNSFRDLVRHGPERESLLAEVGKALKTRDRDEWYEMAKKAGICLTPVYELDEVAEDPQVKHRQMGMELDHPKLGKVRQPGMPIKLSATPAKFRNFAPAVGQNSREILQGLGYSDGQIKQLAESGVTKLRS